jgi:cyclophilin family peptidyl-prolyl cis-trans isomerase
MKKSYVLALSLCLLAFLTFSVEVLGQESDDILSVSFADKQGAPLRKASTTMPDRIVLNGTGTSKIIAVSTIGLTQDITVVASSGLEVSPTVIAAGEESAQLTVVNRSTLLQQSGGIILRSGDIRLRINVDAMGTPLPVKDLSQNPAYAGGKDEHMTFEGFEPGKDGFTLEVKAKTDGATQRVLPFGVSGEGVGFKSYIGQASLGLMNSKGVFVSEKGISNPANGGTFYNDDGLYHTYRYAVTPDERIFVYRDGMPVDTMRVADLALQPEWSTANGEVSPNLIRNGDFEGEWDFSESQNITKFIEGWDVYPYDQYNSYQDIKSDERSNDVDQNNHALEIHRYMWNDGWAAAEISQIVDVAPNEVYSFSCLAKGGQYNGSPLGSIRIQDLQNDANRVTMNVTSDSYQTYAADFSTQATTKQVRVVFMLERAKWGASVSGFRIDDVKLTGVKRLQTAQVGFDNQGADIAYFNYDTTGAFAPPFSKLNTSTNKLTINGTGESATFNVSSENLMGDISVSATHGFAVSPTTIKAGKNATITVTNLTTLNRNTGRVMLRAGDMRAYVDLTGIGSELEVKDISQNPVYAGGSDDYYMEFGDFNPTEETGYTVEIKAKTDDGRSYVHPFAITEQGVGFKGYVTSTSMGLYNGKGVFVSEKRMSNPANGGTFYNTDGLFHTYRYAVTPDRRVFVYRDGLPIDTMRIADLALQPEWSIATGKVARNMIKNGDFEGEYNFNNSRNITDRIEGWDVYPYDQYNSYQDISREERSNEVDQNNHVLEVHRYMWEDGWAAGEISQIVDVAPNEVYSFSCLAKGGIYNGSPLGSIRIQDLQNDGNKVTLNVNSDSYKTYAVDFETKATTQQVRVVFMLERAKWGASVSAFKIDDVKMKGFTRVTSQKVGFENLDGEIEYFNFDATGAYAPLLPGLTASEVIDAIKTASDNVEKLRARIIDGQLQVLGIEENSRVVVYSADGRQVAALSNVMGDTGMALPGRGTYIVGVLRNGKKQVLKIIY